jgi:hypothetical protein
MHTPHAGLHTGVTALGARLLRSQVSRPAYRGATGQGLSPATCCSTLWAIQESVLAPAPGQLPLELCRLPSHPFPGGPLFLTWSDSSKHRQRVVGESHAWGAALRGEGTAEVQLS